MKHLLRLFSKQIANWLAKQYHRLKLSNPVMYTSIGGALLWIQMQLADPALMTMISQSLPPSMAFLIPIIQLLPTTIGLILSPHTSERVKAARAAKALRDGK